MVGAQVTVRSTALLGTLTFATTTGPDGRYFTEGAIHPDITIRAVDPATGFVGFTAGTLNRANGFAVLDVGLVPAGSISGLVRQANGIDSAGSAV